MHSYVQIRFITGELHLQKIIPSPLRALKKNVKESYKLPSEVIKKKLFLTILHFVTITILLYVRNVSIGKDNISPQILLRKAVNSLLT